MSKHGGARHGAGRPPIPAEAKRRSLSTTVSADTLARLQTYAEKLGRPVNQLIETAILASLPAAEVEAPPADVTARPPKVLLVEDDLSTIELMRLRLEYLGCDVEVASTAEEALEKARDCNPSVVLLDMMLGHELKGVEVLKGLRAMPETQNLPVKIHSVYFDAPHEWPEVLALANGVLAKPLKIDALKQLVEEL